MESKHDILAFYNLFSPNGFSFFNDIGILPSVFEQYFIDKRIAMVEIEKDLAEKALKDFLDGKSIQNKEQLDQYLSSNNQTLENLQKSILRPLLVSKLAVKLYSKNAYERFISNRAELETVVYSLIRTKSRSLSLELFLQIEESESSFSDLAAKYSEGNERSTLGVIGPTPMSKAHPTLIKVLRSSKEGELRRPFQLEGWWVIVRLEKYIKPEFNDEVCALLCRNLFFEDLRKESASLLNELIRDKIKT
tara:strand:+ start:118 stop:864 length:747 start_codon:yes stop_codon:yes gene_type:complete